MNNKNLIPNMDKRSALNLENRLVLMINGIMLLFCMVLIAIITFFIFPYLSIDLIGQSGLLIILPVLIAGILLAVANWLIIRSFIHPILSLGKNARLLAEGNPQIISIERNDEIGETAKDFRRIAAYMSETADAIEKMLAGDLSVRIQPRSEQDVLGNALAHMTSKLNELILQIHENAAGIDSSSGQFSEAAVNNEQTIDKMVESFRHIAADISQQAETTSSTTDTVEAMIKAIEEVTRGAHNQANSIEQATVMTHDILKAIRQVAESSQSGASAASEASQSAEQSRSAVEANLERMQLIKEKVDLAGGFVTKMGERSQKIGEIVETIEDFAEQTNLLAINAAIEAARAGEQGRGFAVVADEVRKLAEKSATATLEINKLITDVQDTVAEAVEAMQLSSQEVEAGVELSNQAGKALNEIMTTVQHIVVQVQDIAAASQVMEKSSNELVGSMDAVSEIVEENTTTTQSLATSSQQVRDQIELVVNISRESSQTVNNILAETEALRQQISAVAVSAIGLNELSQGLNLSISEFNFEQQTAADSLKKQKDAASKQGLTGTGFIYRRNFVKENYGDKEWQQILNALSPDTRKLISGTILPAALYPQDAYAEFISTLKKVLGGDDPNKFARRVAKYVAGEEARGAYRSALTAANTDELIRKFPMIYKLQFSHGELKSTQKGPHHFIFEMTDPVEAELCQNSWTGFMQGLIELQGEKNVYVEHISCVHKGDPVCAYEVKW